jgi:hypothetical protein
MGEISGFCLAFGSQGFGRKFDYQKGSDRKEHGEAEYSALLLGGSNSHQLSATPTTSSHTDNGAARENG